MNDFLILVLAFAAVISITFAISFLQKRREGDLANTSGHSPAEWWTPGHTLIEWWEQLDALCQAHFAKAKRLIFRKNLLGVSIVILTTVAGSALFKTTQETTASWIKITGGVLSLSAAVLAGLQSSLKDTLTSEVNRTAAAEYTHLKHKIELALARQEGKPTTESIKAQESFLEEWKTIDKEAPVINDRLLKRTRKIAGKESKKRVVAVAKKPRQTAENELNL